MSLLLRIADRVLNRPLLLHPDKVPLILSVLEGRLPLEATLPAAEPEALAGGLLWGAESLSDIEGALDTLSRSIRGPAASRFDAEPAVREGRRMPYRRKAGAAVLPITGSLVNRGAWVESYSGMTSYEWITAALKMAVNDPQVEHIVLDIDSPGGEAIGAFEAAAAVRAAATQKPVTALINGMAASAAYAIASGATRIITGPSGIAGSIGVILVHYDQSEKLAKAGIRPTLIFAGAHKADGHPFGPLPDSVRADLQAEINTLYAAFVDTVHASGRMSKKAIRGTEARTFLGAEAVTLGLADALGGLEDALSTPPKSRPRGGATRPKGSSMDLDNAAPSANLNITVAAAAPAAAPVEAAAPIVPAIDAGAAMQARIAAILGSEEAKGREQLAQHLALQTSMDATAAVAVLAASPKVSARVDVALPTAQPTGPRASESPAGLVVDRGAARNAGPNAMAAAVERLNAQLAVNVRPIVR